MKSHKLNASNLLLATFILATMVALVSLPGRGSSDPAPTGQKSNKNFSDKDELPVAIFDAPQPADPAERALRQARSSRYDRLGAQPIAEAPPGSEPLPLNAHFWWGMQAIPTDHSSAIVLGEVVNAQAYLSNDKSNVYSEFTLLIKEVLKDSQEFPLTSGKLIAVERPSGAVRFPSGRVQRFSINKQGMPRVGKRYVLFLKYNEQGQDFSILTGYQLRNGRVLPLDDLGPFTVFKGTGETSFLDVVRQAIAQSAKGSEGGVEKQ